MIETLNIENTEAIFCVGDIHGEFETIIYNLKNYDITNSTLIFCGDIGFGFNKPEYYKQVIRKIDRYCKKVNVMCLFIRGNHDDPQYFNSDLFKKGNVRTLRDYTLLNVRIDDNERHILCIGGAISIDRQYRINENFKEVQRYIRFHPNSNVEEALSVIKKGYWENEAPIYDERFLEEIVINNINVDYICTHTCPSFALPTDKDGIKEWLIMDSNLLEDITNEREVMDNVYNFLREHGTTIRAWYYGHYHEHNTQEYDGVRFYMLDMSRYGKFDMVEVKN